MDRKTEHEVVARVDLSRIPKDDVSVYIIGDMLAISGERGAGGEDDYYFQKRVSLPKGVDVGNIKASYKDGALEVIMPKKAEVRKIEISVDVGKVSKIQK